MSAAKQTTLAKSASITGTSLHTGEKVTLTLQPAAANYGYKFRRIDLPDRPIIDADVSKVQTVERATTLAEGSVRVHTVEHILSALVGMGIDNAMIEMDANEPPIGDGSAAPYVDLIKKCGKIELDATRAPFEIRETIHLETKNGSLLTIVPDNKFRISCTSVGPDGRMTHFHTTEINPEIYEKEIAPCRTFVFYEDVKPLLDKGLIRGGSVENAIIIQGEQILSKEPLRFANEMARHKILDIVGDLALAGRPFLGHVIAIKPGHGPNTQLAAKLSQVLSQMMQKVPPVSIPVGKAVLNIDDIQRILPHRFPFLMVDRIVDFEGDNKITGIKNVSIGEPYFEGHFPGHPIMPGVLQIEAMAQVVSILVLRRPENNGKIGYFMSADKIKFRNPVRPGDTLFIECEMTGFRRNIGTGICRTVVGGKTCAEATLRFAVME